MAVTSKNLRPIQQARAQTSTLPRRLQATAYGVTLLLAALAIYAAVSLVMGRLHILVDDIRYGRPRTTQLDAFVGHDEAAGHPTHLLGMNLSRQVVVVELPGGDPSKARTIAGPYLFGADEDLTPIVLSLQDIDGDGHADLLIDVRREQIVYLNKDSTFRPPTAEEAARLKLGSPR
jgi:hypothetical protein